MNARIKIMYMYFDPSLPSLLLMGWKFKGTMSHLQAKKMKKLNSNCIWKIILI